MKSRKLHRIIGLILVLPMLGWIFTGVVFFIKPGYQGAYEQLSLKRYPLAQNVTITPSENWQEAKLVRTILGHHLLVKVDGETQHLDPITMTEKTPPTSEQFKLLLEDAIASNVERYGGLVDINQAHATTSTGVEIRLNWQYLRLSQTGKDTKLINLLYQIHYLQWSPFNGFNQVMGIVGLLLLMMITLLGVRIFLANRK